MNGNGIRLLIFLQSKKLREELIDHLNLDDEFIFHVSTDLAGCVTAATTEAHHILITDINDSNLDIGGTLIKIREGSNDLAVILLAPEVDHLKEIEYLNQGVDYVMSESVKVSLIIARIKASMRWRHLREFGSFEIGPFKFDMETKTLSSSQSEDINLTNKEDRILKYLLSRQGAVVSRIDLLRHVWGYNGYADTHTVETHIYRLRKKIGKFTDSKAIIITEVGGYRLVK